MTQEKGTEGFYLNEEGQPEDKDFHGDCMPENPVAFNRGMWIWGLEAGYEPEGLAQIYGPRPEDI